MKPLLPFAAFPRPANNAREVSEAGLVLSWTPARGSIRHRVLFEGSEDLRVIAETTAPQTRLPDLLIREMKPGIRYAWRVDEVTASGVIEGPVWHFTVSSEGN
jgi:hypothetical protein